ncbi:MAG: ComF family protein [Muribaculaceae bacterium]|nr:ComF family protein [Muribaculaceae bacterium]
MSLLRDLRRLFFPHTCRVCGRALVEGEELLCLHCLADMPRTEMHLHPDADRQARLLTAAKAIRLASMFYYINGNPYSALIRDAKYNGRPDIDRTLARVFASELLPCGFFDGIDLIIPVPMHFLKQARRGYNQAAAIAEGVSDVTGIPVGDNIVAEKPHRTQTRRSAGERRTIGGDVYGVRHPEELDGLHVLVVDDVLTTGATLLACCAALRKGAPTSARSLLTLAATRFSS